MRTDEDLADRAQGLIAAAEKEPQPLSRERFAALMSQVKLLALEGERDDLIMSIVEQALFDLDPDVAHEE